MASVSFQSFADSWRTDIVKQHVPCAQSPEHHAESAAPSGNARLQSSMKFGSGNLKKKLCLLFDKKIKLCHNDVKAGTTFC